MSLRVLVVDDSPVTRVMVSEMLETMGHRMVSEAATVDEALAAYRSHKPDLVILDISLVGGSGLSVLEGIRRQDSRARVIVISGNVQRKVQERLRAGGASGFLPKPFGKGELKEAISRISPA